MGWVYRKHEKIKKGQQYSDEKISCKKTLKKWHRCKCNCSPLPCTLHIFYSHNIVQCCY